MSNIFYKKISKSFYQSHAKLDFIVSGNFRATLKVTDVRMFILQFKVTLLLEAEKFVCI